MLAASPLLFASLRLFLYSGGDPVVLQTLVRTLNVQGVLVGSLLPLSSALFLSAVLAWAFYPDFRRRLDGAVKGRPLLQALLIATVAVELLVGSIFALVAFAVVVVATISFRITKRIRSALGKGESPLWQRMCRC